MSGEVNSVDIDGVRQDTFNFGPWTIHAHKSHILHSKCSAPVVCQKPESTQKCQFCRFQQELKLPSFPDMTFARNKLMITHSNGFSLDFNCLDALKLVLNDGSGSGDLEVGVAEAWKEARTDCEFSKRIIKKFDWTFCTDYMGSVKNELVLETTDERIDMDRLKEKQDIKYYESIELFEDELADHGVLSRVMRDSFFILLRYFLRIDRKKARVHDTRIYHEAGKNYLLREFTVREEDLSMNQFDVEVLTDPVKLTPLLKLIRSEYHKIVISQ